MVSAYIAKVFQSSVVNIGWKYVFLDGSDLYVKYHYSRFVWIFFFCGWRETFSLNVLLALIIQVHLNRKESIPKKMFF